MLSLAKLTSRTGAAAVVGRRFFGVKIATGLVGLPVSEDGVGELKAVSEAILNEVQALPEDAFYRQNVEKLYKYRLGLCQEHNDVTKIEEALGLGNIEEVIQMAHDELSLIPKYVELRMHEPPSEDPATSA